MGSKAQQRYQGTQQQPFREQTHILLNFTYYTFQIGRSDCGLFRLHNARRACIQTPSLVWNHSSESPLCSPGRKTFRTRCTEEGKVLGGLSRFVTFSLNVVCVTQANAVFLVTG